jgi:hypothetical protein
MSEKNKSLILVKDNFFKDPFKVRNIALLSKYENYNNTNQKIKKNVGWRGFRSQIEYFEEFFYGKILDTIIPFYKLKGICDIDAYFHYSIEQTKKTCLPFFEDYKFHVDDSYSYAGVIYLTPNPPKNSGTTFIFDREKKYIENYFNRLICYPSNILHGPTDLFGNDIHTGRMTLTFFIKNYFTY